MYTLLYSPPYIPYYIIPNIYPIILSPIYTLLYYPLYIPYYIIPNIYPIKLSPIYTLLYYPQYIPYYIIIGVSICSPQHRVGAQHPAGCSCWPRLLELRLVAGSPRQVTNTGLIWVNIGIVEKKMEATTLEGFIGVLKWGGGCIWG